jgi:hypothetical protein
VTRNRLKTQNREQPSDTKPIPMPHLGLPLPDGPILSPPDGVSPVERLALDRHLSNQLLIEFDPQSRSLQSLDVPALDLEDGGILEVGEQVVVALVLVRRMGEGRGREEQGVSSSIDRLLQIRAVNEKKRQTDVVHGDAHLTDDEVYGTGSKLERGGESDGSEWAVGGES